MICDCIHLLLLLVVNRWLSKQANKGLRNFIVVQKSFLLKDFLDKFLSTSEENWLNHLLYPQPGRKLTNVRELKMQNFCKISTTRSCSLSLYQISFFPVLRLAIWSMQFNVAQSMRENFVLPMHFRNEIFHVLCTMKLLSACFTPIVASCLTLNNVLSC